MMWLVDCSFSPHLQVGVDPFPICALLHKKRQFLACYKLHLSWRGKCYF